MTAPYAAALPAWLHANYALPNPVACRPLRLFTNDVYLVESTTGRYVLKVYGVNWRTEPEVRYEAALLRHLAAGGLSVAVPLPGLDGEAVRTLGTGAGSRCAVLFSYAPGEKPRPPFTPSLYETFGRAIARMHELSNDFVSPHERRPLDLPFLIDESLETILTHTESRVDRAYLIDLAGRLTERIRDLAEQGLDWGPIHGDASLDNLHVTADGEVVLYDFDSGGPGWRAADLQGWAAHLPEYRARWDAFHRGYALVRSLDPADIAAAPFLTVAWDIWGMKIDLDRRGGAQERERMTAHLRDRVARVRERDSEQRW